MRYAAAIALLLATTAARADDYQRCVDKAGGVTVTTKECGVKEIARLDGQLNAVYRKLVARIDKAYLDDLKKAERAWIAYRDAQCMLEYDQDAPGTGAGLIYQSCVIDLTKERIRKLDEQLGIWSGR